jgi:hypothetical protein
MFPTLRRMESPSQSEKGEAHAKDRHCGAARDRRRPCPSGVALATVKVGQPFPTNLYTVRDHTQATGTARQPAQARLRGASQRLRRRRRPESARRVQHPTAHLTLPLGGRGIDQVGNGSIDSTEGVSAVGANSLIGNRDGLRQTTIDLMQLVKVLKGGVDVDADGADDLSTSRIYYAGQSFGGIYGTQLLGLERDLRAGVMNVPGGPDHRDREAVAELPASRRNRPRDEDPAAL